MRAPLLASVLLLVGCADLGREPWETDVSCIRKEMRPPQNLVFDMAATTCVAPVGGQPLTGTGAHYPPLKLAGAPDLQAAARASGFAYTD